MAALPPLIGDLALEENLVGEAPFFGDDDLLGEAPETFDLLVGDWLKVFLGLKEADEIGDVASLCFLTTLNLFGDPV